MYEKRCKRSIVLTTKPYKIQEDYEACTPHSPLEFAWLSEIV